jgi:Rrf2 family protein
MSSPVRISEAASLGLHAAAVMAESDRPRSAEAIAETLGVSQPHLVKVLQRMSKAGLVRSVRGPGGGYSLTRSPQDISALEVYESIEGTMDVSRCALEVPACGWASCVLGDMFCRISKEVRDQLGRVSMAEFGASVGESVAR